MPLIETLKSVGRLLANEFNAAVGYQQSFEQLLENKDIDRAVAMLHNHSVEAAKNLLQYNTDTHEIMRKPVRGIYNKQGDWVRDKVLNSIAIPYQKFINEIALVFLYGRPPVWENATVNPHAEERAKLKELRDSIGNYDNPAASVEERAAIMEKIKETKLSLEDIEKRIEDIDAEVAVNDAKYERLIKAMTDARFNASLRECKRHAGAEGCSAMLFHTYQQDGEANMLIRVLAKSKKDDIYTLFDQYERLIVFCWGYSTKEDERNTVQHYDIYTKDKVYYCTKNKLGSWVVDEKPNLVKKIPAIVFIQEVEWEGGESIAKRIEKAVSKNADDIDDFGTPAVVATGKVTNANDLDQREEESKFFELADGGDIKYLLPAEASQSRKDEIQLLESELMEKTFTPTITLEALRGLSNASGATLEAVMMLAKIKAERRKDKHDGYLSRVGSLMKSIMENVLDVRGGSYSEIELVHKFQSPFGADLSAKLADLLKQFGAGVLSRQTVLEQSYLVPDATKEMERLDKEQKEAAEAKQQQMIDAMSAI